MADHQLKIYIGGRKFGEQREKNIRALAFKLFPKAGGEGNISALFNEALNQHYHLDPDTGEELGGDVGMVADNPLGPKSLRHNKGSRKPGK